MYAVEDESDGNYMEAYLGFTKVILEDKNFKKAKEKKENLSVRTYELVISRLKEFAENKNYVEGLLHLEKYRYYFPEFESKFDEFKMTFDKQKEEAKNQMRQQQEKDRIALLKNEQLVNVNSVSLNSNNET